MKRLVALLLALILVLGLCACASDTTDDQKTEAPTDAVTEAPKSEDNTDNTNTNEKNYTIGFFVKDNTNPFWRYIVNGAMKAGEDLGGGNRVPDAVYVKNQREQQHRQNQRQVKHDCHVRSVLCFLQYSTTRSPCQPGFV